MASELEKVIKDFYTRLDSGEKNAVRDLTKAYQASLVSFDKDAAQVMRLIQADGLTAGRTFQYQRLQALASQAADNMANFGGATGEALEVLQTDTGKLARQSSIALLEATTSPVGFGGLSSFATVPDSALRQVVGSLQNGSPLRSLTSKYGSDSGRAMNRLLLEGVSLGRSPLETARLMRNQLGIQYSRARTLVRTEQMRVFRETNRETFKKNKDVVKKWKWYAALDKLTCPVCWAMHGEEFSLDERMESHPSCRCSQLPVTASYKDLGIKGVNESRAPSGFAAQSRAGRLSDDFRFPASTALEREGISLFDQLPRKDQEFILGKTAFKAYENKLVSLSDFVQRTNSPLWGKGRATKPLSSLISRDQIRALQGKG